MRRILLTAAVCALCGFGAISVPAAPVDPVEILRAADASRGNLQGVEFDMTITSHENGRDTELRVHVQARGYDFVCEELYPPKYKGQKLALISGNMWFYKPGLSKLVAISQRQRLMGQAANGDIAATNYAAEYEGTISGEESIDGELCDRFELRAANKRATYDRIRYWVSKERGVGVRADYFSVSGKLIKSARMEYDNRTTHDGRDRPFISRIVITDALVASNITTLSYIRPVFRELPDHIFSLDLLGR